MKKLLALILSVAMIFSLVACGQKAADGEGEDATAKKTSLVMQLNAEPNSLDFQQTSASLTNDLCGNLFAKLVTFDADCNVVGDLADSWEWNDDYTEITFHLRDGLKFSDGSALTAEDVVYTYKRGIDGELNSNFAYIEEISAPSENEVYMKLSEPNTVWLNILSLNTFGVMSKAYIESGADLATEAAVCSGAYTLESWEAGSKLTLKANPNYWQGEAEITDVELVVIADENTALIALESGDIDFLQGNEGLSASSTAAVETMDNATLIPYGKPWFMHMEMNFDFAPFADPNVRHAIDLALDRDAINVACGGLNTPAGSVPVLKGVGGYLDGYGAPACNIEKAKEYLAASNYPDGFEFTVQCAGGIYTKTGIAIQSMLKEIGITVNVEELEAGTMIANLGNGSYEAAFLSWGLASADTTNIVGLFDVNSSNHFNNDPNSEYGDLLNECTKCEGAEREAALKAAYDSIQENIPVIGLMFEGAYFAHNADLQVDMPVANLGYRLFYMHWN